MSNNNVVVAQFKYLDDTVNAVAKMRDAGESYEVYLPYPDHHVEHEYFKNKRKSPVRIVTLCGAITGCSLAFLMTSWMSIDYPIRVSAKPYLSFPAFVIPGFEWTVLFGGVWNLIAICIFSGVPRIRAKAGFRGKFTEGTYGISVNVPQSRAAELSKQLEGLGAQVVETEYTR
jgi:hypothetical protein